MKIINGQETPMGRIASYAAKEALKGEEIAIVNADEVIITGNRKVIEEDINKQRSKIGSGQKGPKISRESEKIMKRAVRGMLPNHREGRGKQALKKIKCYKKVPEELKNEKQISLKKENKLKSIQLHNLRKQK
ncbi:MAG: 50S ribosomal protein L13 [Nanoarchaeota archaeon]